MNSSHSSSSGPSPSPSRRSKCPANDESSSVQLDPSRTLLWSASLLYYTGVPSLKIKRSHLRPAVSMSDMDGANVSFKGSLSKSPSTDSGTGTVSSVGTKGSSSTLGRLSFSPFRKRHSSSGSASTNSIESSGSLREKLEKTESMKGIGMRPKKRSSLASFISRTGSLGRYKKHEFASDWTKSPLHIETEQKEIDVAVGAFGPSPESLCLTPSPVSPASSLSVSTSKAFRESLRVAKCLLPSSSSKIALSSHSSSSKAGHSMEDKLKSSDTVQAEFTEPLSTSVSCSNITKPTNQLDCGHKNTKKTKKFFLNSTGCSECEISKHLNLLQNFDKEESLVGFSPAGSCTVIERPVGQQHQKEEKDKADANNKSKKRKDKESKESSYKKVSIVKSLGRRMLRGSSKEIKDVSSQIESECVTSNKAANSIDASPNNISVSPSDCKMPLELVQYDSEPRKLTPKPIPRLFGQEIKVEERNVINHNEINAMEVNNTCIEKVETSRAGILHEESLKKSQINLMEKPKPKLYSKVLLEQNNDKDEANDTKSEETASDDTKVSTVEVSTITKELNSVQSEDSPESQLGEEPQPPSPLTEDITDASSKIADNDSTTEISKLNVQNNTVTTVQSHKSSLTLLQEPELSFDENIQVTFNSLDEKENCSSTSDNAVSSDSLLLKEAKNDVDVSVVQSGNPVDSSPVSTKCETDEEEEGSFTESFKHLEPFSYDIEPVEEGKRERLYKVLVVGELGTGKTSIIKRYVHQFFSQHYRATIGVDFALKVLRWDPETVVRLQLWDIAGQERFGSMTRVYYKEAVGAFVVFDVTRAATLEAVPKWKADLDTKVVLPDGRPIPTVLLANKSDQPKEGIAANREKMNDFCQQQGFSAWFETSAKDNINIDESANFLVSKILEMDRWSQEPLAPDPEKLDLSANGKHKAGGSSSCAC